MPDPLELPEPLELRACAVERFAAAGDLLPLVEDLPLAERARVFGADPFPPEPERVDPPLRLFEDRDGCDDFWVFWAILTSL